MGLLELFNWRDQSQKQQSTEEINVNGSHNILSVTSQHLANQTEIEIGLEILIVLVIICILFYLIKKFCKFYKKRQQSNKEKRLKAIRECLNVSVV